MVLQSCWNHKLGAVGLNWPGSSAVILRDGRLIARLNLLFGLPGAQCHRTEKELCGKLGDDGMR